MRRYVYRDRRRSTRDAFLTGFVRGLAYGLVRALWRH